MQYRVYSLPVQSLLLVIFSCIFFAEGDVGRLPVLSLTSPYFCLPSLSSATVLLLPHEQKCVGAPSRPLCLQSVIHFRLLCPTSSCPQFFSPFSFRLATSPHRDQFSLSFSLCTVFTVSMLFLLCSVPFDGQRRRIFERGEEKERRNVLVM